MLTEIFFSNGPDISLGMNSTKRDVLKRYHLLTLIISLSLFLKVDCQTSFSTIFMGSPEHCGQPNYKVSTLKGYAIQPNNSDQVNTSFIDCKMTFESERIDGRLCISQEGKDAEIKDSNVQLNVSDGLSELDPQVFSIGGLDNNKWNKREYCTNSSSLYMHLEVTNSTKATSTTDLDMLFKIQDIQSRDRIFYLEEDYCDTTYELENSQITIVNRLPYNSPMPARTLRDVCPPELERKMNESLRTCLVYVPSEEGGSCGKGWEFWSTNKSSDDIEVHDLDSRLYNIECRSSNDISQEMEAWCASNTLDLLTIVFVRMDGNIRSDSPVETPGMFSFVVVDYPGSEEELIKMIQEQRKKNNSGSYGILTYIIGIIAGVVAVVLGLLGFSNCRDQETPQFHDEVRAEGQARVSYRGSQRGSNLGM